MPQLADINFVSPGKSPDGQTSIYNNYDAAVAKAKALGIDVSKYTNVVYDANVGLTTGADYIAKNFAWESAGYYWEIADINKKMADAGSGVASTNAATKAIGGIFKEKRAAAYEVIYDILSK